MCQMIHLYLPLIVTINLHSNKILSLTFSSFSKCSRRNFIGRSGLVIQRLTMHSFRICWMLCFCTNISQPFKLSSSSIVEEVAILSFKSVAGRRKIGWTIRRKRCGWVCGGWGGGWGGGGGGVVELLGKTEKEHVIYIMTGKKTGVIFGGEYSAK